MNYHEKLEEYINNSKYNTKNFSKIDDDKSENTIKLTNRNHKESVQFSIVDDSSNFKTTNIINSKTFVIGNNNTTANNSNTTNNNYIYDVQPYKFNEHKLKHEINASESLISHHNYTTIDAKRPEFTESLAYNTRNYSNIIKDCLNFDEVSNYTVRKLIKNFFKLYFFIFKYLFDMDA